MSTSGCGGCLPLVPGGLPLGLGGYTPRADTPPVEITIEAGGTHPTGMHSCLLLLHQYLSEYVQKYNAERSFVDLIRHILAELPIAKNQSIKSEVITFYYSGLSVGNSGFSWALNMTIGILNLQNHQKCVYVQTVVSSNFLTPVNQYLCILKLIICNLKECVAGVYYWFARV